MRAGGAAGASARSSARSTAVFGAAGNPLRQLGALGFHLFWVIVVSGVYVYIFYDTSVDGAHASVEALTHGQWWAGGVMRSLHRYASDAFVAVLVVHLLRELMLGRFSGFRWYSWLTGVPLLWLALTSGIVGYWLVWDRLALFVGVATTEWFAWLPGFGAGAGAQFPGRGRSPTGCSRCWCSCTSGCRWCCCWMWMHIQRLDATGDRRRPRLALWTLGACWRCRWRAGASRSRRPTSRACRRRSPIDWFYLFPCRPCSRRWSPGGCGC